MNRWRQIVVSMLLLLLAAVAARLIIASRPEPIRRPEPPAQPVVDAVRLSPAPYPVTLYSQGTVQPASSTTLIPEVTGSVVDLSVNFVVGGTFSAGERLVQIDRRDYDIVLTQALANLASAEAALQEERALARRAREDWNSLGRGGQPSALTLRKPQVAAATAALDAARASVQRAELDLERTQLLAPYTGRVLSRSVDKGQFVSRGALLGRIHAIDAAEVRLPLTNRQLGGLDLPLRARAYPVELQASVAGREERWVGTLDRMEGVEATTQQFTVVARIEAPYANARAPLRVGQFVRARIAGRVLEDVFVIPRSALREDREVVLLDEATHTLHRQVVRIAWSDELNAAVDRGIDTGDLLVVTPLAAVVDGTPVRPRIDRPTSLDAEPVRKPIGGS